MLTIYIRTDKPEAELGLYDASKQLNYLTWPAHRQLAETIHSQIKKLLQNRQLSELEAVVVYKGPGSFTGLRIGLSVANAMAQSLGVPIVAVGGEDWIKVATTKLQAGQNDQIALPEYGAPPHITKPKH